MKVARANEMRANIFLNFHFSCFHLRLGYREQLIASRSFAARTGAHRAAHSDCQHAGAKRQRKRQREEQGRRDASRRRHQTRRWIFRQVPVGQQLRCESDDGGKRRHRAALHLHVLARNFRSGDVQRNAGSWPENSVDVGGREQAEQQGILAAAARHHIGPHGDDR